MTGLYCFGTFALDSKRGLLSCDGATAQLAPKTVAVLSALVEHAGQLVSKDDLLDQLWPEGCIEPANVSQHIYLARAALRRGGLARAIETVPRRGYRFVAPVEFVHTALAVDVARLAAPSLRLPDPPSRSTASTARAQPRWPAVMRALTFAALCGFAILALSRATPSGATVPLSAESQRLYEIGRFHWNLRGAGLEESVRDFAAVVHRDPKNPLGYAGLADAYLGLYDYPCNDRGCVDFAAKSMENARRAVELGPDSAVAHTSLAMSLHVFGNSDARADVEFLRAINLDPRYAPAHEWYGNSLLQRGRLRGAWVELEAARALDPTAPTTYAWLARDAYYERRYGDAIRLAHEALSLAPGRYETRVLRILALEASGQVNEALAAIAALGSAGSDEAQLHCLLAPVYSREGKRRDASRLLDAPTLHAAVREGFGNEAALALISVGDSAGALRILAGQRVDRMHRAFLALDPRLDAVRKDPRFKHFVILE